jgi:hypothetical protein
MGICDPDCDTLYLILKEVVQGLKHFIFDLFLNSECQLLNLIKS